MCLLLTTVNTPYIFKRKILIMEHRDTHNSLMTTDHLCHLMGVCRRRQRPDRFFFKVIFYLRWRIHPPWSDPCWGVIQGLPAAAWKWGCVPALRAWTGCDIHSFWCVNRCPSNTMSQKGAYPPATCTCSTLSVHYKCDWSLCHWDQQARPRWWKTDFSCQQYMWFFIQEVRMGH